jgi:transcription elongation factor GreB
MSIDNSLVTTPSGLTRLETELRKREQRLAELVRSKAHAAEVGGNQWHDNASFEELERQERILRRQVATLRGRLARITVIDEHPGSTDAVAIGSVVTVRLEAATVKRFRIGGYGESDPAAGVISVSAPLANAVLGSRVGDARTFTVRGQAREVTVEEIE